MSPSVSEGMSRQSVENRFRLPFELEIAVRADIFVSMRKISKRELVRNPSLASHLKPGESIQLEDGKEPLMIARPKRVRLSAEQIHAELDRLCKDAPEHDTQVALRDLRE